MEVGQPVQAPCGDHRGAAAGVEAEETDARLPVQLHVGAHVQLREVRHPRQRRRAAKPQALHDERRYPEPRAPVVVEVQRQGRGHDAPEPLGRYLPMREEQVTPGLRLDPRPVGQGPGPVLDFLKRALLQRDHVRHRSRIPARGARTRVAENVERPLNTRLSVTTPVKGCDPICDTYAALNRLTPRTSRWPPRAAPESEPSAP